MTFEEAKADWLDTLAKHPGTGFIPSFGAWASMCGMRGDAFRTRCYKTHRVEVAKHTLFRTIYHQERAEEYLRLRALGHIKLDARAKAGICIERAQSIEPFKKKFYDWPTLWESARAFLAEDRTTHELAAQMNVNPQLLLNLRSRGLPAWVVVEKRGAFLAWRAKGGKRVRLRG